MDKSTLLNHMTNYYSDEGYIANILYAISNELTRYKEDCIATDKELIITTSHCDIEEYEKDFVIDSNKNNKDEYRISNILAKLRGLGIVTIDNIKDIVNAYTGTTCDVEVFPKEFTLIITIKNLKSEFNNFTDLIKFLNSLKTSDWIIKYRFICDEKNDSSMYISSAVINRMKYTIQNNLNCSYNINSNLNVSTCTFNINKYTLN